MLKDRRNACNYRVLVRLAEMLPAETRVRIVADPGFSDHKLYRVLTEELKEVSTPPAFRFSCRHGADWACTMLAFPARRRL